MITKYVVVIVFIKLLILQDTTSIYLNKASVADSQDSDLNSSALAFKYGYLSEQHSVVTDDGYILTIFRMRGKHCEERRTPVLLMHGLLMSSDSFLDAGPGNGLAYLLADSCYDLWVGNCRGNYYSRAHITLNPDHDTQFWNFSYDEMGYYDVPATIDYILDKTGNEKLSYVGYSQGAGAAFIMCSERPAYCNKLNVFIALAPSTQHINTKSPLPRLLAISFHKFERVLARIGVHEVMGKPVSKPDYVLKFCQLNSLSLALCQAILPLLDSYHPGSVSYSTVQTLFGHFSAGTSVHNMAQYGQAMINSDFLKYDYGADNMKIYGCENPPNYNLKATTVPVVILYGENDGLSDKKDIEWLVSQLPNVLEAYLVPDPLWNHLDVVYSEHIARLLFPKIKKYLLQYSYE